MCGIASSILYEYRPILSLISASLPRFSFVKEFKLFFNLNKKKYWWYLEIFKFNLVVHHGNIWEALLQHVSVWVIRHEDILLCFCPQLLMRILLLYCKCTVLVQKSFLIVRLQESLLICGIVCRKNFTRRTMMYWQHCLNHMWRG